MTLPTFVVIGAAKSGTTSLTSYLRSHPDVFMSYNKEPHYFTREWDRGLEWYESLFTDGAKARAVGEASTSYTMAPQQPEAPRRMAELLPGARLIYLVRHPLERIRSQYAHNLDRALEARSLSEAIRTDPGYLDATRYDYQIRRFAEFFAPEQLHVVVSERLRSERESVLAEILQFVGVDPSVPLTDTDRELNRMADKRLAPPIVNRARRAVRALGVNQLLSRSTRERLRLTFSREMPDEAVAMSADDKNWILSELDDDLAALRQRLGPQIDAWGLDAAV